MFYILVSILQLTPPISSYSFIHDALDSANSGSKDPAKHVPYDFNI